MELHCLKELGGARKMEGDCSSKEKRDNPGRGKTPNRPGVPKVGQVT